MVDYKTKLSTYYFVIKISRLLSTKSFRSW